MKAGRITAKLRDAVPVCFMEDGKEMARYRNIDIPDELKELEIMDFQFNVPMDGKITFELLFDKEVLPEVFPPIRPKLTRAEKAAAKAAAMQEAEEASDEAEAEEPINEADEATEGADEPADIEIRYNVTGDRRKELVVAAGEIIGWEPVYKAAPSFAYAINNYTIDKTGTLTGPMNQDLIDNLAERGFIATETDAE